MKMNTTRRWFLQGVSSSVFLGGCASRIAARRVAPNDKVNVGVIGCGLIAKTTNVPGFLQDDRCRVTTVCDVVEIAPDYFYGARGSNFGAEGFSKMDGSYRKDICGWRVIRDMVNKKYGNKECRVVTDWREVVDDPAIDAVAICTPDHWHAIMAIAAMKAGKHVFCQKPMSLSVEEGQAMVRVAKETGVTFQVGNQGSTNPKYRLSEEIVLNGYAGKVTGATICIPACDHWAGHGRSAARAPLPRYFTKEAWDMWQGPARHWEDDAYIPSIHDPTCWRFNNRYGGGMARTSSTSSSAASVRRLLGPSQSRTWKATMRLEPTATCSRGLRSSSSTLYMQTASAAMCARSTRKTAGLARRSSTARRATSAAMLGRARCRSA